MMSPTGKAVAAALLVLALAAPGPGLAKPGNARPANGPTGAPSQPAPPTASQANVQAPPRGWKPVLTQRQKQCRAQHGCAVDADTPCVPCRGK